MNGALTIDNCQLIITLMLLAIDIGNTNIKLGVWNGRSWLHRWRMQTAHEKTADEYGLALRVLLREHGLIDAIDGVIMASVVPPLTATFAKVSENYLGETAVQVNYTLNLGIDILTDEPAAVGADRLANAVAVHTRYPGATIIVDMGTASKFEVLTTSGAFYGGVIAPGLRIMANALAQRAAQLRHVELVAPPQPIGKNTVHAVQSGLIYGYVGLVEGILRRLMAEHPDKGQTIQVVGTGGLLHHILPHTNLINKVDDTLTLMGLCIIDERVRPA